MLVGERRETADNGWQQAGVKGFDLVLRLEIKYGKLVVSSFHHKEG
jgi:hypothetical protein